MDIIIDESISSVEWTRPPRIVEVYGDIDDTVAKKFKAHLHAAFSSPQTEVPIYINSEGGEVYALLAMLDSINSEKEKHPDKPIVTICWGKAMSAAAALFCKGDFRYVTPNSTIMIHNVQIYGCYGSVRALATESREASRLDELVMKMIMSVLKDEDGAWLDTMMKNNGGDCYLDATQAIKYGIATHIGSPSWKVKVTATSERIETKINSQILDSQNIRAVPARSSRGQKRKSGTATFSLRRRRDAPT